MNPIVTLAAGIVLGALGVRYGRKAGPLPALRNRKDAGTALIRDGLDRAGSQLRGAAITGLSVVEKQSGQLRQKLEGEVAVLEPEAPKKVSRTKRSPRKPTTGAPAGGKTEA